MNLADHTISSDQSGFVATSKSPAAAAAHIGEDGYVYSIRNAGGGVDVNATLGPRSTTPNKLEVAIPGKVPRTEIIGVQKVLPGGRLGPIIPNPNYRMTHGFL